jgi:hypothetical protein
VNEQVTYGTRNARVAGLPESNDLAARRAVAAQAIPLNRGAADRWKQPEPKRENLGQLKMSDPGAGIFDIGPDTPHALSIDVGAPDEPDWLQDRPEDQEPPPTLCIRCPEPLAPGHKAYCTYHKELIDAEPFQPAAMAGGSE